MSKYVGREVKINEIDFILMDIVCFENDSFNYKDIEECDYGIGCETYIDGKEIVKEVIVPKKLVSIVVK